METYLRAARTHRGDNGWRILADFADLLAIPNVTRDVPAQRRNAEAIAARFAQRGVAVEVIEHDGAAPVVIGRLDAGSDAGTLGIYVHYDGQPVDQDGWLGAPFTPQLRTHPEGVVLPLPEAGDPIDDDWRLHARGSADDKAPLIALLAALDAMRAADVPAGVNLVFCFEGEEESGSPHLRGYLDALRDRLRADAWLICDGPVHHTGAPQIALGARGCLGVELTVYGPERELHSGHYGNWVPNPALELARILAGVKDDRGRVTIDGFYDQSRPVSPAEQALLDAQPPVEEALLDRLGVPSAEVPGSRLVDRLMLPSFNVRGLSAASTGDAARNVIPASATASIDIRLAAGDDPDRMRDLLHAHLNGLGFHLLDREPTPSERRAHPRLARLTVDWGYPAVRTPAETPVVAHLTSIAARAAGREPVVVPTLGGSVPMYDFTEALGAPTVVLPIANPDNNQHAANENLRLGNLWYGVDLFTVLMTTRWPVGVPAAGRAFS